MNGEVAGTWRRTQEKVTVQLWGRLSHRAREAIVTEAETLPLPGLRSSIAVAWED